MKNMRTLQKRIAYQLQQGSLDAEVTGVTYDSRKVQPQNVFVCIRGSRTDGHVYAEEAVEKGASVLIAEHRLEHIPEEVAVLLVKDSREALAQLSCALEDDPAQHLVTIGVTGTKGKTTTAYMIYEILQKAGIRTGLVGTIETRIGARRIPSEKLLWKTCSVSGNMPTWVSSILYSFPCKSCAMSIWRMVPLFRGPGVLRFQPPRRILPGVSFAPSRSRQVCRSF